MDNASEASCNDLDKAISRLELLSAHDALRVLRTCFSAPKIMHILCCSPCSDHTWLLQFYLSLHRGLSGITNSDLTVIQWIQASLPVRAGVLGFVVLLCLHLSPIWLLPLAHVTSNLNSYSTFIQHQILSWLVHHVMDLMAAKKASLWSSPWTGPVTVRLSTT